MLRVSVRDFDSVIVKAIASEKGLSHRKNVCPLSQCADMCQVQQSTN